VLLLLLSRWSVANRRQFNARPSGFQCSPASPAILQSYCDSTDPYCCNGNDANSHQQYVNKYGQQALTFIKSKLDAAP
jgi:acetylxylan esterase